MTIATVFSKACRKPGPHRWVPGRHGEEVGAVDVEYALHRQHEVGRQEGAPERESS